MVNKIQKQCRTCVKMFTPCSNCENDKKIFHWRKVACSPTCAKKYFAKIEKSRQLKNKHNEIKTLDITKEKSSKIISNVTDDNNKPKKNGKRTIINKESEQIE